MINWHNKRFAILEFTRAYDPNSHALRQVSRHKADRYSRLLDKLRQHLPATWEGSIQTFTMGIRGSFREAEWKQALMDLGVSASSHRSILQSVVSTTLTSLESVFTARSCHMARVVQPGTDPPQARVRTDQRPPLTHPLPPTSANQLSAAARAPV